jgi:tetraacyldisaccharide-1-P 4'-kinase
LDLVTTKKDFLKIDELFLNKIKYLDIDLVIKNEMKLLKKII